MEPLMEALLLRPRTLRVAALALAALLTVIAALLWAPQLRQWDERTGSFAWSMANPNAQERRVVVIDVDEKSVQALGSWPWSRARMADLLNHLDQAGVSLKVLDVLFDGPREGDAALTSALMSPVPTVAAEVLALDDNHPVHSGQLAGALPFTSCPTASMPGHGYLAPLTGLLPLQLLAGHITPIMDADGAIRQVPALICQDNQTYAALPIAALMAAGFGGKPQITAGHSLSDPAWWLTLGDLRVPLDNQGRFRVSYQIPRAGFVSVSASDVLSGQAPKGLLKGAWVLVGSTAFGAGDAVPTPLGGAVGGVEVHAEALSAMLDERTPYTPRFATAWPWATGALIALLLLATIRITRRSAGLALPLAAVLSLTLLFTAHTVLLLGAHLWVGWIIPALYTLLATSLLTGVELIRTRFERERLFQNLSSYLPEAVARQVALQGPSAQVHAHRHEATVMFVDLRNFSSYCEGRPPEETATVLHLFYTTATRVVEGHGGVVEQMVGDGLMAVWNGSAPCADHGARAIAAADELWRALSAQLPNRSTRRTPALDVGMGLESGTVLVGSFGAAGRRVHTVLGETVTVASRLESMTAELAYPILLGPQLMAAAKPANAIWLGEFLLPGLSTPRILHALPVEYDQHRLRLVYESEGEQRAVG